MNMHPPLSAIMAQAVIRWLLTTETWVQSLFSPCEICGGQNGNEKSFPPSISVFSCQNHSTNATYSIFTFMLLYLLLSEGKAGEPGNLQIKRFSYVYREHWKESNFTSYSGQWNY
jgi:hypothetical protein